MNTKKILITFIISVVLGISISSCSSNDRYSATQFKNIHEIVEATKDTKTPLNKDLALFVIDKVSVSAANALDPKQEVKPVATAAEIIVNPQINLQKIIDSAISGPTPSGWLDWATWVGGAALVLGAVGQFLGGPYAIAGNSIKLLASKFVPNYDRTKTAAVGVITSLDQTLLVFSEILDSAPETKKALKEKLNGEDPIQWFKDKLNSIQTDIGAHNEIASLINSMKKELTTKNGVISPSIDEFDKFIAKKV